MDLSNSNSTDGGKLAATGRRARRGRRRRESLVKIQTSKEMDHLGSTEVRKSPKETTEADLVFVHGLGGASRKTWSKGGDSDTLWPQEGNIKPSSGGKEHELDGKGHPKPSSSAKDQEPDGKEPLGLTTIYQPPDGEIIADIVFVHGLGGGSRKTWMKGNDPSLFWPQEWLPKERGFESVRLHTFGYNSNLKTLSTLNMLDFAKSLLTSLLYMPSKSVRPPLILIGHSLGGLVIKQAYLYAQQSPEYGIIAECFKAVLFFGTPHRGSNMGDTLSRVINIAKSRKSSLMNTDQNTRAIQSINTDFITACQKLQLWSFYETRATSLGITNLLIVETHAARVGLPHEHIQALNSDHRNMCKFSAPNDSNYLAVRSALATVISHYTKFDGKGTLVPDRRPLLKAALGDVVSTDSNLMAVSSQRFQGSCQWLLGENSFLDWQENLASNTRMLWIQGPPGSGKSVIAGFVVEHLTKLNLDCCFYFFSSHQDRGISAFLRAMAWQLAELDPVILDIVVEISRKGILLNVSDHETLWRRLYLDGILQAQTTKQQYWVIDALDECADGMQLLSYLVNVLEISPFRVVFTSRSLPDLKQRLRQANVPIAEIQLGPHVIRNDMALYVENRLDSMNFDSSIRRELAARILVKAENSFLWIRLVLDELEKAYTMNEINKMLEDIPSSMEALYSRILQGMLMNPNNKTLVQAILMWMSCSARPLTVSELNTALQLDLGFMVLDLSRSIATLCGQILCIDAEDRVRFIHATARDYLLAPDTLTLLSFDRTSGHSRLATICLKYLVSPEVTRTKVKKSKLRIWDQLPFANYACTYLHVHVSFASSDDDELSQIIGKFLNSQKLLCWIEYVAYISRLDILTKLGNALARWAHGRSKVARYQDEVLATTHQWAIDLVRLSAKFGQQLLASPSAIFDQIPSFCPPESAIFKQFGNRPHAIQVLGGSDSIWDDCVTTIRYSDGRAQAVACTDKYFAVSLTQGQIFIYDTTSYQRVAVLNHGRDVRLLYFWSGSSLAILASADHKSIKVWDVTDWKLRFKFPLTFSCLALAVLGSNSLSAALKSNVITTWDLQSGDMVTHVNWTGGMGDDIKFLSPQQAIFHAESKLLAIGYRGHPLVLYDVDRDEVYNTISNGVGIMAMSFMQDRLAILYMNTELVVVDILTSDELIKTNSQANIMTSSPNGRFLATADRRGVIEIFNSESLSLVRRIWTGDDSASSLRFTLDSQRLLDIRTSSCNVWQPIALSQQSANFAEDESDDYLVFLQNTVAKPTLSEVEVIITANYVDSQNEIVFFGKDDGSIWVSRVGLHSDPQFLFHQTIGIEITSITYDDSSGILTTADASGHLSCRQINKDKAGIMGYSNTIFNVNISTTINQVLYNKDHSRLLVSSQTSDYLFEFDDTQQNPSGLDKSSTLGSRSFRRESPLSISWIRRNAYTWAAHPTQPDTLILFMHDTIHLYTWNDLRRLSPRCGISYTAINAGVNIQSICAYFNNQTCVVALETKQWGERQYECFLIDVVNLRPRRLQAVPTKQLPYQIEYFIGSLEDSFVFLDSSGWVCSATAQLSEYSRRFFLPSDWLNTGCARMMDLTDNGSLVFVKRNEVIFIQKGLTSVGTDHAVGTRKSLPSTGDSRPHETFSEPDSSKGRISSNQSSIDRASTGSNEEAHGSSNGQLTHSADRSTAEDSLSSGLSRSLSSTSLVTYSTEITHHSREPKVSIEAEMVNFLVNHESFQPLYIMAMSKPEIDSDKFSLGLSRSLKSYARDLLKKAEGRSQVATAQLVHARFQFIAQSICRRYDTNSQKKDANMLPNLKELPVQSVAETVDRFLDRTYGPLDLQGGEVGNNNHAFLTKRTVVRELPSNVQDHMDDTTSNKSGPLLEDTDQAPDLYRYPENFDSFREVKAFLTSGEPFEDLERYLKELVDPESGPGTGTGTGPEPGPEPDTILEVPESTSKVDGSRSIVGFSIVRALVERLLTLAIQLDILEGPPPPGYTRIEWVCACGATLHDDFLELRAGALDELKSTLAASNTSHSTGTGKNHNAKGSHRSGIFTSIRAAFDNFRTPAAQKGLPTNNTSPSTTNATQTQASTTTSTHLYLLSCLDQGSFGVKLHHELLTNVTNDRSLFQFLRDTYKQRQSISSWLSMKTIRSLNLVRFSVDISEYVDIKWHHANCTNANCVCLPPDHIVEPSTPAEYRCEPVPASYIPPMGKNYLMHYLRHPQILNPKQTWVYNQLPKRLCGQLLAPNNEQVTGWGMHFEEGISWRACGFLGFTVIVVGSCVFGVVWGIVKGDVQTGFTVAAYWSNIATVVLGFWAVRIAVRGEG